MMNDGILVSIITVVYNGFDVIEETIKSIISQSYKNIQYIIIDGNSNDSTIELIKQYSSYLDTFISEKDTGIYDAMNKGLSRVKGTFVLFMNAGDSFYSKNVIEDFIKSKPDNNSNYYGDVIYNTNDTKYLFKANLSSKYCFLRHNTFSHQAIFYSKNVLDIIGNYNLKLRVSADFDLTYRMFKKSKFINLNKIVSLCNADGFSTNNAIQSYKDRMNSFKNQNDILFYLLLQINFPIFLVKNLIVRKFKNTKIYNIYRKLKYKDIFVQ